MKDEPRESQPGDGPPSGRVLGSISGDEQGTASGLDVEKGSRKKADAPPAPHSDVVAGAKRGTSARPKGPYSGEGAGEDKLRLPRRGLVAMRKSGGLRFTSREVVVYRDGTVVSRDLYSRGPESEGEETRRLNDAEFAALYRALESAELYKAGGKPGRHNPDAYAYELAARLGTRTRSIEVNDGSIPSSLAPLIEMLSALMQSGAV